MTAVFPERGSFPPALATLSGRVGLYIDELWTLCNENFMISLLHLSAPVVTMIPRRLLTSVGSYFPEIIFASHQSQLTDQRKLMEKYLEPIELNDAELAAVAGGVSITVSNSSNTNFSNSDIGDVSVTLTNSSISNSTIGG